MKWIWMALWGGLLFAPCCYAHKSAEGSPEKQSCSDAVIEKLSSRLALPEPAGSDDSSPIVVTACKINPADHRQPIVAVAYDQGEQDTKSLFLAIVDHGSGRVIADYEGKIDEDATLTVQGGSLRIDTARYLLARGVRAFGLDISGWSSPDCGDGGVGPTRTLYVREGAHIRPVLDHLYLSDWHFIARGNDRCNSSAPEDAPTIIENTRYTLSVLPETTHGFHDLRVTATSERDDGDAETIGAHWILKYDGKTYPTNGIM